MTVLFRMQYVLCGFNFQAELEDGDTPTMGPLTGMNHYDTCTQKVAASQSSIRHETKPKTSPYWA